ncbi:MAG: hypothetical protein U0168_28085 [Nannocystaceae bacterium]
MPTRAGHRRGRGLGPALGLSAALVPAVASARPRDAAVRDAYLCRDQPEHVDLGSTRYTDPRCRRGLWLGADVGGVVLPARLGLFDRTVWTVRAGPAWAVRPSPWLSLGGRHGLTWYDAGNARLRVHDHQVELALHPWVASGHRGVHDRLTVGLETHAVLLTKVEGVAFKLGGVRDVVATVGYGAEHRLARRWALGWHGQLRQAWVFVDTQRQLRLGLRAVVMPRPRHRLALESILYAVDRNPRQAGTLVPRRGAYAQFALDYAWMGSPARNLALGPAVRLRYATGFLTGEAPIYEVREESLSTSYVDLTVGVRASWR